MRVLIVNCNFKIETGADFIACETYKLLKENGHDVCFFASDNKPYFEDAEFTKYFTHYPLTAFEYAKHPLKYYYNREAEQRMREIIKEFKPDVVHLHYILHPAITFSIIKPCIENNLKIVFTLHDSFLTCPATTLLKNNKNYCHEQCCDKNKLNCFFNNCGAKGLEQSLRLSILAYFNKSLNYLENVTFITPSEALKKICDKSKIGNVKVINNFAGEFFERSKPSFEDEGYFLFSGRLVEEKGIFDVIKAAKLLPENIKIHIVGRGNKEKQVKNLVKKYGLKNIDFKGFMDRKDLYNEYKNCIATIVPSTWFENFPTIIMESFFTGKPVIASNIGGIVEMVEDNKTGMLFEVGDYKTLASKMMSLFEDRELTKILGKNAYNKAKNLYTTKKYLENILNIYE